MKSKITSRKLKFLVLVTLAMILVSPARSQDAAETGAKKEVLTGLGQRMLKRVTVDFRDTPIDDVIRIMASQADVDIVKSPKVTGTVTATLTNVPLEEALTNILAAHGFGYVTSKNMIRIAPLEEITQSAERLVSRIYRITYADVDEVEKALYKFISKRGSISSNPGTSNVIVTDTESKIKAIDTFIGEIDRITPQILVEARIYDITNKDRLDLGIEWQAGTNTTYDTSGGVGGIGVNPTDGVTDAFMTGLFDGTPSKTENTSGLLRVGWLNDSIDIDAILRAQKENIDAKLLANPRILVLDNEMAEIKIISEIPYQELTESSDGGSIGTTEFREVGVTLKVTPHLTRDNIIRLVVQPEFSVQTGEVQVGSIDNQFPQPVVDRRIATTTLLIESGKVVVLGGLKKKDVSQQVSKVPLLADIPILGELFTFHGEETINSELVVFIKPVLVENPVMTDSENKIYQVTEFQSPDPLITKAEKDEAEN